MEYNIIEILERKSEGAVNRIRIFLILIFCAALASVQATGGLQPGQVKFYVLGILLYLSSLAVSLLFLWLKKYYTHTKYYQMLLEVSGVFTVSFSNFLHPESRFWLESVQNVPVYSIYFLLMGSALLRFSPRFVLLTGLTCTASYLILFFILISNPEITFLLEGSSTGKMSAIDISKVGTTVIFMLTMTVVLVTGTRYVRRIVIQSNESEINAKSNFSKLNELMSEAQTTVNDIERVSEGLNTVSIKNDDLSRNQLASIEETSSTMEEMSSLIESIASKAGEQSVLSLKNSEIMKSLNDIIFRFQSLSLDAGTNSEETLRYTTKVENELTPAFEGIKRIHSSALAISDILNVINDISDRTNLLALNAAIEAARAGAEGRGFSIVAEEVGKLAELSSNNAKEIDKLITSNRRDTEHGVKSIEITLNELKKIIEGIKKMVSSVNEINELSTDQKESSMNVLTSSDKIQNMAIEMKVATHELHSGSNEILKALESLNISAEDFTLSSDKIRKEVSTLSDSIKNLKKKIESYSNN